MERTLALQIIEANLNRLREGIRVAEELLRYTPGAEGEFGKLKRLRLDAGDAEKEARRVLGRELSRARRLQKDAGKDETPTGEPHFGRPWPGRGLRHLTRRLRATILCPGSATSPDALPPGSKRYALPPVPNHHSLLPH